MLIFIITPHYLVFVSLSLLHFLLLFLSVSSFFTVVLLLLLPNSFARIFGIRALTFHLPLLSWNLSTSLLRYPLLPTLIYFALLLKLN